MLRLASLIALATLTPAATAQLGLEWGRGFDNLLFNPEDGYFTAVTTDASGRIFAAAISVFPYNTSVACFNSAGTKLWHRAISPGNSVYSRAHVTPSGDVLFVGHYVQTSVPNCSVRSYTTAGVLNWSLNFPTASLFPRTFQSRLEASGALVLAGRPATPADRLRLLRIAPDSTVTLDTLFDPVPGTAEEVLDLDLADNGDALLCGSAGASNFLARISTTGQVLWNKVLPFPPSGSTQMFGVRAEPDGNLVTLELESSGTFGPRQNFRRYSSAGVQLGLASIDEPLGTSLTLNGFERSSDGAFWSVGRRPGAQPRLVVTRCDAEVQTVQKHVSDRVIDGDPRTTPCLAVATAGQVWAAATATSSPQTVRHGALMLFGPDLSRGPQVRLRIGNNLEQRTIRLITYTSSRKLIVAGFGDSFTGPLGLYFDPIPWIGQVDVKAAPAEYCSAQTDSAGCTPNLVVSGLASANPGDEFVVRCIDVSPQRSGLFFYGFQGPTSAPLGGGTLCVASPVRRGPLLDTGASTTACGGQLELDWAAFAAGTLGGFPHPNLQLAGTEVCAQTWIRDSALPGGALLSAAVRWIVLP